MLHLNLPPIDATPIAMGVEFHSKQNAVERPAKRPPNAKPASAGVLLRPPNAHTEQSMPAQQCANAYGAMPKTDQRTTDAHGHRKQGC